MTVTPTSSPNFAWWMKTPNDRMTMTRQSECSAGDCKPILSDMKPCLTVFGVDSTIFG